MLYDKQTRHESLEFDYAMVLLHAFVYPQNKKTPDIYVQGYC